MQSIKQDIINIGKLLWDKDLVTGYNGNISRRIDAETIAITAKGTCLGLLKESDIVVLKLNGEVVGAGQASSERVLHCDVYKNFPQTQAVIHTHTPLANGYFLEQDIFYPRIFEAKFYLGEVKGIPQLTPAVTDTKPVVEAFRSNNIVALKNHGVVTMGNNLFDCFVLIQALEEAIETELVAQGFKSSERSERQEQPITGFNEQKKYKLFSQDQINEIVKVVNGDPKLKELGVQTNMTMDLAVKLDETGKVYSFNFEKGKIVNVGNDANAEFLINAPENIWRAVFNQEIDPFVATTQKKMHLKGDFAKISRWYAPCSRVFELWQKVPVE